MIIFAPTTRLSSYVQPNPNALLNRTGHIITLAVSALAVATLAVSCIPDSGRERRYYDDDEYYDTEAPAIEEVEEVEVETYTSDRLYYIAQAMQQLDTIEEMIRRGAPLDEIQEQIGTYSQYCENINALTDTVTDEEQRAIDRLNERDIYVGNHYAEYAEICNSDVAPDSVAYEYYD